MDKKEAAAQAKELVGKMTIEEKISQLKYDAPSIPKLNIPAYNWWNEGLHGVARAGTATIYPQAIALAAMFDRELVRKIADQIAEECRAKYNACSEEEDRDIYKGLTLWCPNINIFRDPRWGRGQETFGEDPYLTQELGVAFVRGLQGNGKYLKTAACAKHFAVHSGPERLRHEFDAHVTRKDMAETYLPAFEAVVKDADVAGIMGAYNRVNGVPCCGNRELIQGLLRKKWGFSGYFVSDCWAIRDFHTHHGVTDTPEQSAAMALGAGCDLNCGCTYLRIFQAYKKGMVKEEQITRAAEHLMTIRIMLGEFDEENEYNKIPYDAVECREHLDTAEEAAGKGCVLLKNTGILPLNKKNIRRIGVIGPNADSKASLIGNYYGTSSEYITLLQGIKREVGDEVKVLYSAGCHISRDRIEPLAWRQDRISEARTVAKNSDIIILHLGLDESLEGEEGDDSNSYASGDKADLNLPQVQEELLREVVKTGKPVVLCVSSGSALNLNYAETHCEAILQVWYPGARGGKSISDILFGRYSPSGKLPVTFYKSADQLPPFEDYSMKGRTYRYITEEPLYPFGYGLTYGKILVDDIDAVREGEGIRVSVGLKNTGKISTHEVVQIYLKNLDSEYAEENYHLCGFERVHIMAGQSGQVSVFIEKEAFYVTDDQGKRFIDGNRYRLYAGLHQPDKRSCELSGDEVRYLDIRL